MEAVYNAMWFLHSWVRWLLLGVCLAGVVYFAAQWLQRHAYDAVCRRLLSAFSGLVALEWLLGVGLVGLRVLDGRSLPEGAVPHLALMTVATLTAHSHFLWRGRALTNTVRYRRGLAVLVGSAALIGLGIAVLPSAAQWRFLSPL